MICVPISWSSRGSSAFTLACVPTGMNTGVSMTPCAVVSFPRRALVCESVLRSLNISVNQNRNAAPTNDFLVARDQGKPVNARGRDNHWIGEPSRIQTRGHKFAGLIGDFGCDGKNGDVLCQRGLNPFER